MVEQGRQREVSWHNKAWRALASMRLALCLLAGLVLLMCLATLLPQPPGAMDEPTRSAWFAAAQRKYSAAYPLLSALGLLDLYGSPLFLSLVAVLLINTAVCTVDRARGLLRVARRRPAAAGTLMTHVSLIALVLSVAATGIWSWERAVALATGETCSLDRGTGLLLRNDALNMQTSPAGGLLQFSASLALLQGDRLLRTSEVRPNAPFRGRGINAWLLSYEPGVRVVAYDDENQPLQLVDADGQQHSSVAICNLSFGPQTLSVPAEGLQIDVSALAGEASPETFYLQVERSDTGDVILAQEVAAGSQVRLDTVQLELAAAPYAVYRVKHDPAAGIVLFSAAVLLLGNCLSLFTRRERPA